MSDLIKVIAAIMLGCTMFCIDCMDSPGVLKVIAAITLCCTMFCIACVDSPGIWGDLACFGVLLGCVEAALIGVSVQW